MPKTRRRAGDRTAGADWQRGCLIDRAEVPGFYKFCAKGRAPLVKWSISVIGFCTAEGRTSVTGMILEQYRVSVRREGRPIPCFCAWRERGRGGQGDRRDSKKESCVLMMKHVMNKPNKLLSLALALGMTAALLAGCGQQSAQSTQSNSAGSASAVSGSQSSAQNAEKVRVGLAWLADFENGEVDEDTQAYIDAVTRAGGEPVLLEQATDLDSAKAALDTVDALILTGGEDVDPSYYNEEPDPMLEEPNPARDTSDYWMMTAALDEDFPTLATCRGMQVMNVVCGGTLYQDLPTQFDSDIQHRDPELVDFTYHDVTIEDGSLLAQIMGAGKLNVNSWHHQGIKTVGEGLTVTAHSDDGLVEALEMQDKTFMLGVQFHPEWRVVEGDDSFLPFFTALMDAAEN